MIFQAVNDEKCVNCVEKTNNLHNSQAQVLLGQWFWNR